MGEALELAREAGERGEIPVGAVVVDFSQDADGVMVGRGFNLRERDWDPSAHAEIVAMREAGRAMGSWRLLGCTLYVTLEPCPMCAGAMVNARLPRVVYGCGDPKAGAVDTLYQLCTDGRLNHRLEVVRGVRGEEAAGLLRGFFAGRRRKNGESPPTGGAIALPPD
jgi:tRNA(adenine34) deaminase